MGKYRRCGVKMILLLAAGTAWAQTAGEAYQLGMTALAEQRYEQAYRHFEQALASGPQDADRAEYLVRLGEAYGMYADNLPGWRLLKKYEYGKKARDQFISAFTGYPCARIAQQALHDFHSNERASVIGGDKAIAEKLQVCLDNSSCPCEINTGNK